VAIKDGTIFVSKNARFGPQKGRSMFVGYHNQRITLQRHLLAKIWWKSVQLLLSSHVKKKHRTCT